MWWIHKKQSNPADNFILTLKKWKFDRWVISCVYLTTQHENNKTNEALSQQTNTQNKGFICPVPYGDCRLFSQVNSNFDCLLYFFFCSLFSSPFDYVKSSEKGGTLPKETP